jgi:DNA polymerase delta subunit 1
MVAEIDPDIVTGYNILGFDFKYIQQRAEELGIVEYVVSKISRFREDIPAKYTESRLSSSALGDNVMCYHDMPGRVVVDILKVVQRDHKLDSYKLDFVAERFMNERKNDVSPNDIFRLFRGTAADRAIVAEYCVMDCVLCNRLMMKLDIIPNTMGMANVCSVPMHCILFRGQGIKIFSLVAKQARELGFAIPVRTDLQVDEGDGLFEEDDNLDYIYDTFFRSSADGSAAGCDKADSDGYEGAIVLDPEIGMHKAPVAVLDYASLYPSSMISENLSHDTIVLDERYDNLPGATYNDIVYDLYEGSGSEKVKVGEKRCRFAQSTTGVLPHILQQLLKQRKVTRKRMTLKSMKLKKDGASVLGYVSSSSIEVVDHDGITVTDTIHHDDVIQESIADFYSTFQKSTLDGLQLAYKITANSLYGANGARTSPIYLKDIAACTTATGRKMIMLAKSFLETNYGAQVIYGDTWVAPF